MMSKYETSGVNRPTGAHPPREREKHISADDRILNTVIKHGESSIEDLVMGVARDFRTGVSLQNV